MESLVMELPLPVNRELRGTWTLLQDSLYSEYVTQPLIDTLFQDFLPANLTLLKDRWKTKTSKLIKHPTYIVHYSATSQPFVLTWPHVHSASRFIERGKVRALQHSERLSPGRSLVNAVRIKAMLRTRLYPVLKGNEASVLCTLGFSRKETLEPHIQLWTHTGKMLPHKYKSFSVI